MSDAILATTGAIRTLVDGTLRLTVDIEPKDAQAAFALFGKPGSPVALARITNEAAVSHDRRAQAVSSRPTERKLIAFAGRVAITCGEYSFQRFCRKTLSDSPAWGQVQESGDEAEDIARFVRAYCGVKSRRELNTPGPAQDRWRTLLADYEQWQRWGGAA